MAKLHKYHDVSVFTTDKPTPNGLPVDHAKYDATAKSLVATNGKIAIVVPVAEDCDAPDGLIPSARLTTAADKEQTLTARDEKLAVNGREVKTNHDAEVAQYPNVFSSFNGSEPDLVVPLTLETLGPLAEYAAEHGKGGIYLCVHHTPGKCWQDRKVETAIEFWMDLDTTSTDKDGQVVGEPVQAIGVLMPAAIDHVEAVHERVRGAVTLSNSGKSAKERAANKRTKAVKKKAAAKVTEPKAAKNGKATEEDATTTKVASKAKKDATKKGKATNGTAKATPTAKAAAPKQPAAKPNGDAAATGSPVVDLLTRAKASLSRDKFAAARRFVNQARNEIAAGNAKKEFTVKIDELDDRISAAKAAKKGS